MVRLKQVKIAKGAFIYDPSRNSDYKECYQTELVRGAVSMKKCLAAFLYTPAWLSFLYKLRAVLVKPFGLKTEQVVNKNTDVQKGDRFAFFEVLERNDTEILLYGTDKHLEAWCAIEYELCPEDSYVVRCSTVVKYHNLLGKIYFFIIRPFHYFVIRALLNRVCQ